MADETKTTDPVTPEGAARVSKLQPGSQPFIPRRLQQAAAAAAAAESSSPSGTGGGSNASSDASTTSTETSIKQSDEAASTPAASTPAAVPTTDTPAASTPAASTPAAAPATDTPAATTPAAATTTDTPAAPAATPATTPATAPTAAPTATPAVAPTAAPTATTAAPTAAPTVTPTMTVSAPPGFLTTHQPAPARNVTVDDDDEDPKDGEAGSVVEEEGEGDGGEGETPTAEDEEDDDDIRLVPNAPQSKPRVYDPAFLLTFRSLYKDKPEGLPDNLEDILTDSTKKRPLGGSGDNWSQRGGDRGRGGNWSRGGRGGSRGGRGGLNNSRGGKTGVVPKGPIEAMPAPDPKSWQPRREGNNVGKAVTRILNKVSAKFFQDNCDELLAIVNAITDEKDFKLVVSLVFDRALELAFLQPDFSVLYASLCNRLQKSLANTTLGDSSTPAPAGQAPADKKAPNLFRRFLLNKCQEEFENKNTVQKRLEELTAEDKTDEEVELRKRMLGNVIFIGELFKLNMLTDKIMHAGVISQLLTPKPTHLDLEALCKLFTTVGKLLDTKNKEMMDDYFKRMHKFAEDTNFPPRIRFMISDVIDLRANRWVDNSDATKRKAPSQDSSRDPSPPRGGQQANRLGPGGSAPRRAVSTGNIPAKQEVNKVPGEWEVVGGGKGTRGSQRADNRRDAPPSKQQPQGKSASVRGSGGASARGGGRASDWSGSRGGTSDRSRKQTNAPSGGRGGRSDGPNKRKDDSAVGTLNPFSLLGGDDDPSSPSPAAKKAGSRPARPSQELYVPGARRAQQSQASGGGRGAGRRPPEDDEEVTTDSDDSEAVKEIQGVIEEYLLSGDSTEAADCLKESSVVNSSIYYLIVVAAAELAVNKKEGDRAKIAPLLNSFKSEGLLDNAAINRGFTKAFSLLSSWTEESPYAQKYLGAVVGQAVLEDVVRLSVLSKAGQSDLTLVANALEAVAQKKGDELGAMWSESGLDVMQFVKSDNQNKKYIHEYLTDRAKVSPAVTNLLAGDN
eukprot:TRINITY_DN2289_c0_g2_i1.p1 TRINITY_DN2289_c0_g2~~TRINITY_DN2289_c0_g2_i1.p1  ORF type:complete len:1015 (+),score=225.49 TRINITY_DN2289_c0_g2_i1:160-3204(+)